MQAGIKKITTIVITGLVAIATLSFGYNRIYKAKEQTNRNEQFVPNEYSVPVTSLNGYSKIYENDNFEYYFRTTNSILKIRNKKSGFVWSTGAGTKTNAEAAGSCKNISVNSSEYYACAVDAGPNSRGTDDPNYYAEINQLIGLTYFNGSNTSSDAYTIGSNSSTALYRHSDYENEFLYNVRYQTLNSEKKVQYDFIINMRMTFTDDGIDVKILDSDILDLSPLLSSRTGYNPSLESITIFPRLGQSGGKVMTCAIDDSDGDGFGDCTYNINNVTNNPSTDLPGYIFVPDGSGALIRFDDIKYYDPNKTYYFDMYGDPYRANYTTSEFMASATNYSSAKGKTEPDYVPTKQISMPVWGVSYGNNQDAFVAYVTSGDEYFGLVYEGRKKKNEYASIKPRFERNRTYLYRFGTSESKLRLKENELFHYDIGISYNFLSGDGSDGLPANYIGMALKYRDYLLKNGLLKTDVKIERGPRVDFLICDVKNGIFTYEDVNVTSTSDIDYMLNDLDSLGIKNIHSTLYGWQNGGNSTQKPWQAKYNTVSGGELGYKSILDTADKLGYSINFYQQYALTNEAQIASYSAYCVKSLARDYGFYVLSDNEKPISWWEYVNPNVATTWMQQQIALLKDLGPNVGIATGGIDTLLVPDYGKNISYGQAARIYRHATSEFSKDVRLVGDTPNSYLWQNYSDFNNISVYNSQLQCETDSVPFMEIVFSGLINLYAEYSNFSFYDKKSQLRMIDFNLNPSFIISWQEKEEIMVTNARDWFSTGYSAYRDIIKEINDSVMPYLEAIKGKTLVGRVIDDSNGELGLYVNTYAVFENGAVCSNTATTIAINYLDHDATYKYNGKTYTIPKESAMILD